MVCAYNPYNGEVETMHAGEMETGWPATLTKSDYLINIIDPPPVTSKWVLHQSLFAVLFTFDISHFRKTTVRARTEAQLHVVTTIA